MNAIHLAQSKGLNRQPDKSWDISEDEAHRRSYLWWAIFSLEHLHALSCSRLSAINYDNMSVHIPAAAPRGSRVHVPSLNIAYRLANICSRILHQVLSVKAFQLSPGEMLSMVMHFHHQLMQLLEQLPAECRLGMLSRPSHTTPRLIHILYLHFSIYGCLMAVHSPFFYPWLVAKFPAQGTNAELDAQLAFSSDTVADAARKMILATRLVTTNVATPSWLALSYPLYAHINLFIYILKYPTLSTTSADLGLLDVCIGHFGYIDFLTNSQISISLPRETASLASKVIKAARAREFGPEPQRDARSYRLPNNDLDMQQPMQVDTLSFDNMENDLVSMEDPEVLIRFPTLPP